MSFGFGSRTVSLSVLVKSHSGSRFGWGGEHGNWVIRNQIQTVKQVHCGASWTSSFVWHVWMGHVVQERPLAHSLLHVYPLLTPFAFFVFWCGWGFCSVFAWTNERVLKCIIYGVLLCLRGSHYAQGQLNEKPALGVPDYVFLPQGHRCCIPLCVSSGAAYRHIRHPFRTERYVFAHIQ